MYIFDRCRHFLNLYVKLNRKNILDYVSLMFIAIGVRYHKLHENCAQNDQFIIYYHFVKLIYANSYCIYCTALK